LMGIEVGNISSEIAKWRGGVLINFQKK